MMGAKSVGNYQGLICEHVDAARRVARRVARNVGDPELAKDVESAALVGLTEAALRFDAGRGEPFFAFAVKRVRGAALDELRRADRVSRRERSRAKQVASASAVLEAKTGRPANDNDVASVVGVSTDQIASTRARIEAFRHVSFDEAREAVTASTEPSPAEQAERAQDLRTLSRALTCLDDRDQSILQMYFCDAKNLRQIGDELGVSESRICQLRSRAITALRCEVARRQTPAND